MKKSIRNILMGDTVFTPYSKITVPGELPEKVYLETGGGLADVSSRQWILCMEPIVFGVWVKKEEDPFRYRGKEYRMHIGGKTGRAGKSEVTMTLDLFDVIEEEEGALLLLQLRQSRIRHLPFIKTYLLYYRYYRGPGMPFERFKSFVSAYSYPRRIRLISFRQDAYYNIFPMDLLGDVPGQNKYVFGLRHTNTALPRIMETGKLVVSEVPGKYKEIIYGLGKHHSGSPPPLEGLPFDVMLTRHWGFYIPDWVESYKEVNIIRTINMGSHMLLWGESAGGSRLTGPADHLFLVHFLHYLHQKNKGLPYQLI